MPDCKYEVIIYWSKEDAAFIAEVPELPGCAGDESRIPGRRSGVRQLRSDHRPQRQLLSVLQLWQQHGLQLKKG